MISFFQSIFTPRRVFLVDGLGALCTAFCIWLLMSWLTEQVGLPVEVMRILFRVALIFAAYSLACHFIQPAARRPWLALIMTANLLYAFATVLLLWTHRSGMQPLGWVYFMGEILVIVILLRWEWQVLRNGSPH